MVVLVVMVINGVVMVVGDIAHSGFMVATQGGWWLGFLKKMVEEDDDVT